MRHDRVIVLTDKPQKALPAAVWDAYQPEPAAQEAEAYIEREREITGPILEAQDSGCYAVPCRHGGRVFWKPRLPSGNDIDLGRIVADDRPFGYGTISEALRVANEEHREPFSERDQP